MNAHVDDVPVEKTPLPLVSGVGAGCLLARRNVLSVYENGRHGRDTGFPFRRHGEC
jgi:hypothetical protein